MSASAALAPAASPSPRFLRVAALVLVGHAALIWALAQGLAKRPVEVLVPAQMIAQVMAPTSVPKPQPTPPAPPIPPKPTPPPKATPAPPQAPPPRPLPAPVQAPTTPTAPTAPTAAPAAPSTTAPAAPATPAIPPSAPATAAAPPAVAAAPSAPPAPAPVQLPSTQADYLQNPKPAYPVVSLRMGESGRAVHRVWIGPDGRAQRAELVKSSGFPRLDKASYEAVMSWRYVPGKRGGVPELMAFEVPISWELPN